MTPILSWSRRTGVCTIGAAFAMAVFVAGPAVARDQIRIVGSSTVFPFTTTVAERFGQRTGFRTPIVESTGTGGGLKLFCAGIGEKTPDVTNASRRIKESEYKRCRDNGVSLVEVKIGFDGIVIANARQGVQFGLSARQLFQALAARLPDENGQLIDNPYVKWSDIDAALPDLTIEVLGPPPTSGTRDAFVELAMEAGAKSYDVLKAMSGNDKKMFQGIAHALREDGAFIEAGENDNLMVQKLQANPDAVGIFGFSFLDQNADKIKGIEIDGIAPTFEAIGAGDYPISRSLYFYVKREHVDVIPGIAEFLGEFTSEDAWGEDGYLADKGLIPLEATERDAMGAAARALEPLAM